VSSKVGFTRPPPSDEERQRHCAGIYETLSDKCLGVEAVRRGKSINQTGLEAKLGIEIMPADVSFGNSVSL
jgi:hypothetical protein